MAYAQAAQANSPSFYVGKSWHNRFAGPHGNNIKEAEKKFKIKITLPPRESNQTGIYINSKDQNVIHQTIKYFSDILGFAIDTKPLIVKKVTIYPLEINKIISDRTLYFNLCKKYGISIAFPPTINSDNNNNQPKTNIQGRSIDVENAIKEISTIIERKIELNNNDSMEEKSNHNDNNHKWCKYHTNQVNNKHELNEVLFFHPNEDDDHDFERFIEILSSANVSLDICVFTITDNRIRNVLSQENKYGTKVRIITDNSQAETLGSDIKWLNDNCGIPVKVDFDPNAESHMHHKFVIIDKKIIMTGSFNWTRSASLKNYENILITNNKTLVNEYQNYFNQMWLNDKSIVDIQTYYYQTK